MPANLSSEFDSVAHKVLVAVDLPNHGSNQHELNGVSSLRDFFRTTDTVSGEVGWAYFADDREPLRESNRFTFYDSRANNPDRSAEWRFYYNGDFLERGGVGDLLVLVRARNGQIGALVFDRHSSYNRAARVLFGIDDSEKRFTTIPDSSLKSQKLELLERQILQELEIEPTATGETEDQEVVLQKFGNGFPTTREMSAFAREKTTSVSRQPDELLVAWLSREEELFRALENVVVMGRVSRGFKVAEEFVQYSLSVLNRRKSRMGYSLQNHLEALFRSTGLKFTPQARTEADSKPDFIFPGEAEYHNPRFSASLLVMLGAKSTLKERWRQVLTEADRIPDKHLCTLQASISRNQMTEMQRQQLKLVIPKPIQKAYAEPDRSSFLSLSEFVEFVREKQRP